MAHTIAKRLVLAIIIITLPVKGLAEGYGDSLARLVTERIVSMILQQYSGADREKLSVDLTMPGAADSLTPCTTAPGVEASRDNWLGSVRLTLTCPDSPGWRLNVRATVGLQLPVATLSRSLPRNHVLSVNDITFKETNIARLRQGYFLDADAVAGTSLVRNLNRGQVLSHRNIEVPTMIQRGDTVTILATGGGVVVSMEGTALADGVQGRQIPVRNNSSQRELRAWVVDRGIVEVPFVPSNASRIQ